MATADFNITFEVEPIVKIVCRSLNCRYNLMNNSHNRMAHCNLKNIAIDDEGWCMNHEDIKQIEKVEDRKVEQ